MNPDVLISELIRRHVAHAKTAEKHLQKRGWWASMIRRIARRETVRATEEARSEAYREALTVVKEWRSQTCPTSGQ